ncbi:MAG: N-acetylmuramoyl-L-alanine amidase, partial [Clostridia bacterium]|nr:N-acetylmuramoyl-L-alanine amidase [Clostridia bacterium]
KLAFFLTAALIALLPIVITAQAAVPVYDTEERAATRQAAVTQNKSYTVEYEDAVPLEGYTDDGNELTDGMYAPVIDYNNTDWIGADGWVGYKSESGEGTYSVTVTVDMGYVAREIGQVFIRTMTERRISGLTPFISVKASVDGESFFTVGDLEVQNVENKRTEILINRIQLEETFSARYIRVTFVQDAEYTTLTDEICVSAYGEIEHIASTGGDSEGRIYDFYSGYAIPRGVLGNSLNEVPGYANPTNANFDEPDKTFYIGEGFGQKVKVVNDFMSVGRPYYSHYVNDIRYIVIHNTGMCEPYSDADYVHDYLVNKTDGSSSSWHYTVDGNVIYHGLPDAVAGWHAATNYNFYTIGIEICLQGAPVGPGGNNDPITSGAAYDKWYEETFTPAMENAAVLTAELLVKYELTPDKILQHTDVYYFQAKQCPYYMRLNTKKQLVHDGTGWKYFMDLVNEYYNAMTSEGTRIEKHTYSPSQTLPNYVIDTDGTAYLVTETVEAATAFVNGDADYNGKIDKKDAELIRKIILGEDVSHGYPDANNDGKVTLNDYMRILRKTK